MKFKKKNHWKCSRFQEIIPYQIYTYSQLDISQNLWVLNDWIDVHQKSAHLLHSNVFIILSDSPLFSGRFFTWWFCIYLFWNKTTIFFITIITIKFSLHMIHKGSPFYGWMKSECPAYSSNLWQRTDQLSSTRHTHTILVKTSKLQQKTEGMNGLTGEIRSLFSATLHQQW